MRNVSGKHFSESQNTFYVKLQIFPENRAVYEIMWRHLVEPYRAQMTILRMLLACWIINATDTHTQSIYYLLIFLSKNDYANATQYYVLRTLLIFFFDFLILPN